MRVFLSSTQEDLAKHRACVAARLRQAGHRVCQMEDFGSQARSPRSASLREMDGCEVAVFICAHRYGSLVPGSRKSFSSLELQHAEKNKKKIFCFLLNDDVPWPPSQIDYDPARRRRLTELKERVRREHTTGEFSSPEDLAGKVVAALSRHSLQRSVERAHPALSKAALTDVDLQQVCERAERLAPLIEGARVLVVNDKPRRWALLTRVLREMQVEYVVVKSTTEALDQVRSARRRPFHAVISDIRRGKDPEAGHQLLRRLERFKSPPRTILTVREVEFERGTPAYAFAIADNVADVLNYLFDVLERARGRGGHSWRDRN